MLNYSNMEVELDNSYLDCVEPKDILEAIRSIPDKYSDVFNLFYFEDLNHKEISELIGIQESSSRSRLARAKKMLKKEIEVRIPNLNEKKSESLIA